MSWRHPELTEILLNAVEIRTPIWRSRAGWQPRAVGKPTNLCALSNA